MFHIAFVPPSSGGYGLPSVFSTLANLLAPCSLHEGLAPDRKFDLVILGINPILPDLRKAKKLAAELVVSGHHQMMGVCFDDGFRASLPLSLIAQEFSFPILSIVFDREMILLAENQEKNLLEIASKSKMVASLKTVSRNILEWLDSSKEFKTKSPLEGLPLKEFEEKVSSRLWDVLMKTELTGATVSLSVQSALEREIQTILLENPDSIPTVDVIQALQARLLDQFLGWGPLQELIDDPDVSEVMVNGPKDIYVERAGRMQKESRSFVNDAQLRVVIERMASAAGRRVDTASPFCDARLPNGCRVNIVLPPLSLNGPLITVRRFRQAFRSIGDLIAERSLTPVQADILAASVREKKNILIAGGSSSGKTTLLNILSGFIGKEERIISLEDAAELNLQNPHAIRLETRKKNLEGVGEISMSDLVVNALRMRPDRIIIGECRGVEAIPMLQAMNTGHDGSMTTLHSNSAEDAIHRLEAMVLLGAAQWPASVIRQQIASAVDRVVYLKRISSGRICEEICALDFDGKDIVLRSLL